jgi:hypothetical protein
MSEEQALPGRGVQMNSTSQVFETLSWRAAVVTWPPQILKELPQVFSLAEVKENP